MRRKCQPDVVGGRLHAFYIIISRFFVPAAYIFIPIYFNTIYLGICGGVDERASGGCGVEWPEYVAGGEPQHMGKAFPTTTPHRNGLMGDLMGEGTRGRRAT